MVKARKHVLARQFDSEPKETDFKLIQEELPPLKNGEMLVEAVWLSVDPYMRGVSGSIPVGTSLLGTQVARILESRNKAFPVGKLVLVNIGWQDKAVIDADTQDFLKLPKPFVLPDFKGLPASLALGTLGMPGNTAYFGFLEICKPKPGEVVVVTGAAGAVGSVVGQIAKIKGCKVIGFAGSDEKVTWLTSELGFDYAFNYKTTDISEALKKAAPNGVDCFFDNVGGKTRSTIIRHVNDLGRISLCGSISSYNVDASKLHKASATEIEFGFTQWKIENFVVTRWSDRWMEGINQMFEWIMEGKLKYRETVTEGFENMPKALIEMMQGKNIGKAVVKA